MFPADAGTRCLPLRLKSRVFIAPGTHNTEESLNRQINDKERVAAALENPSLHIQQKSGRTS